MILGQLFSKFTQDFGGDPGCPPYSLCAITVQYQLGSFDQFIDGDRFMPFNTGLYPKGHLGLPVNSMAVLQTCRKLLKAGAKVFYSMYEFRCFQAESFRCKFVKHIGTSNLSRIKTLTLGLPYCLRTMPSKYLSRYVQLLENMPSLQQLVMTTASAGAPRTMTPRCAWIENNRGLRYFAAWMTLRSSRLNFVTWQEVGTLGHNRERGVEGSNEFDSWLASGQLSVVLTRERPPGLTHVNNPKRPLSATTNSNR